MSKETKTNDNDKNVYMVPGSIIISGLIIAGTVFATQGNCQSVNTNNDTNNDTKSVTKNTLIEEDVLPVSEKDHVFGSRDADVFLIEYSDYKCGYCARFHNTIKKVLDEYGDKIAWVYRHTPYQHGGKEAAVSAECVAEFAGEDAFWSLSEDIFENSRSVNSEWLKDKAIKLGVNEGDYEQCIRSGKYDELITKQTMNAQALGGGGTPYNVLLTKEGGIIKFSGAQPFDNVKIFIDRALRSLKK